MNCSMIHGSMNIKTLLLRLLLLFIILPSPPPIRILLPPPLVKSAQRMASWEVFLVVRHSCEMSVSPASRGLSQK
jgi:hypothetical protein